MLEENGIEDKYNIWKRFGQHSKWKNGKIIVS